MFVLIGIPFLVAILLALPALQRNFPWGVLTALFYSAFGIVLPLFVFFLSAFLVPDCKQAAANGWIDCFFEGKLLLSPLVLWATASFFAVEIYKVKDPTEPLVVLGYLFGAISSSMCLILGIISVHKDWNSGGFDSWMLVPIYVAIWYTARAVNLMLRARIRNKTYAVAVAGSLPLLIGSIELSRRIYAALPETSGCFVVTAASRGHRRLVGPFFKIKRGDAERPANRQLLTFWQFEDAWHRRSLKSHSLFRRIYNRVGPVMARRITRPWMADVIYFAIKPVEIAALFLVRLEWIIFKNQNAREAVVTGIATDQTKTVS
jgi:hypothetical protein